MPLKGAFLGVKPPARGRAISSSEPDSSPRRRQGKDPLVSLLRARTSKHKHLKPSSARPFLAAGTLAAAFVVGDVVSASAASAATPSEFAALRQCESSGNYAINTGNGYYGAYQFDLSTWRGLGLSGYPHQASAATQDAAAATLQSQRGWGPWPGCTKKLGLGSRSISAPAAPAPAPARASRSRSAAPTHVHAPTAGSGVIAVMEHRTYNEQVEVWQARMVARGWRLAVDGYFGPESSSVAERFAAEKGLRISRPGALDSGVFDGAFQLPVT